MAGGIVGLTDNDQITTTYDCCKLLRIKLKIIFRPQSHRMNRNIGLFTGMAIIYIGRHRDYSAAAVKGTHKGKQQLRSSVPGYDVFRWQLILPGYSPGQGSCVRIRIMKNLGHGSRQNIPERLGRPQGINIGAEIQKFPGPTTYPGCDFPDITAVTVHHIPPNPSVKDRATTASASSQDAPRVSPVAPPIFR